MEKAYLLPTAQYNSKHKVEFDNLAIIEQEK